MYITSWETNKNILPTSEKVVCVHIHIYSSLLQDSVLIWFDIELVHL